MDRGQQKNRRLQRVPTVDELPPLPVPLDSPIEEFPLAFTLLTLRGNPDITYQALRDSAGVWTWVMIATG